MIDDAPNAVNLSACELLWELFGKAIAEVIYIEFYGRHEDVMEEEEWLYKLLG